MFPFRYFRLLFRSSFVILISTIAPAYAQSGSTPPPIQIQTVHKTVVATGLTPGGAAAVVTSWRIDMSGYFLQNRTWRDARADQSGAISVAFGYPPPPGALVAVIDVAGGRLQVFAADGSAYPRAELPEHFFKRDEQREVDDVLSPQDDVLVVVLRPGIGAWLQTASDGGARDADGRTDGRILTKPEAMTPIAHSGAPPKKIKHRDLVLAINIDGAAYASAEVAP